ncbi:MAG: tRNA glutamyl-Q(34) synthetase GluQRS [Rhodobacteraceae bacterium]|nr:tRNA glutamyl-Q(34) synthetase GluQRS [Paracoccaceae bacterium]
MYRTRFAPSPTGPLHLGHAYSASVAYNRAKAHDGAFLLRLEDVDRARSKPEWAAQIEEDLTWLDLRSDEPVWTQSDHRPAHDDALSTLIARGLVFPCKCRRADIRAAMSAPQEGVDGLIYPGTCRSRVMDDYEPGDALRLNMSMAIATLPDRPLEYIENCGSRRVIETEPAALTSLAGDVVLGRRDTGDIAYHLAVVVDDAAQGITEVVRGEDLAPATPLHVLLQRLLDLPTPEYFHHPLVRDDAGKRLAKRDDARAIATYRAEGLTPQHVMDLARTGAGLTTSA